MPPPPVFFYCPHCKFGVFETAEECARHVRAAHSDIFQVEAVAEATPQPTERKRLPPRSEEQNGAEEWYSSASDPEAGRLAPPGAVDTAAAPAGHRVSKAISLGLPEGKIAKPRCVRCGVIRGLLVCWACLALLVTRMVIREMTSIPSRTGGFKYFEFQTRMVRAHTTRPVQIADLRTVQLAEFRLFEHGWGGTRAIKIASANSHAPSPAGEESDKAVDGNMATKWLDDKLRPLHIELAEPTAVESMEIVTANDAPGRDPVSFRLLARSKLTDPWEVVVNVETEEGLKIMPLERGAVSKRVPVAPAAVAK
jgi:hypothetical protein